MIKSPLQQPFIRQLPFANKLAACCAALCLGSCLILIAASQQSIKSINNANLEQLGNQLSQQLAISARPALIQGDTLSLQSLLVELASSTAIHQAAIFNVENKPVAEAGERIEGKAYMAPIHYQDSIAGHSLIIINNQPLNTRITGLLLQQLLLSLLLSACCYALCLWLGGKLSQLFEQLQALIAAPNYPNNTRRKSLPYPGQDELQQLIEQTLKGPNPAPQKNINAELALLQINFEHQDTAPSPEQLKHYQQQLNTIGKLYDGRVEVSRPYSFSALFYQNKDENDHPFKALCCGKIIEQLFSCDSNSLAFNAVVTMTSHSDDFSKQQLITQACAPPHSKGLYVDPSILAHSSVSGRIDGLNHSEGEIVFNAPYNELIERQFSALQLQLERS
ncbi:hypothetical protein NO559_09920 [Dasania sp. GY-MA-18]|uniref:Uncharacterized protein n=1 Tax=Dasania phycosphaerae TaxID=2950436 RepID=A0A9J6RMH4_9GAMM|nr:MULTISPECIES: hypothetical protein [Dasania]MCR8923089.1 hypothetical protein [Dasania sp. GY-MA-18]MCZ0865521.1 hypothetical protein [Dasania phycosphaerae]MCZ0869246.1 hypothetical protein [Dasania phycosphaerae]